MWKKTRFLKLRLLYKWLKTSYLLINHLVFLFIYKFISINSKLTFLNLICSFYFQATVHFWLDINTFFCNYGLAQECVLSIMRIIFWWRWCCWCVSFIQPLLTRSFLILLWLANTDSFYFGVPNEYKWKRTERKIKAERTLSAIWTHSERTVNAR